MPGTLQKCILVVGTDVCYVKCRKCGKKASKYERYVSPTGNGTSEIDSLLC